MNLIGTADAAEILGLTPETLRYWRYMNQGPRSFRIGRHVKYRREDIDSWLESRMLETARGGV
jgi:predicted DNA-binding transcriptional regulator AlpA